MGEQVTVNICSSNVFDDFMLRVSRFKSGLSGQFEREPCQGHTSPKQHLGKNTVRIIVSWYSKMIAPFILR